ARRGTPGRPGAAGTAMGGKVNDANEPTWKPRPPHRRRHRSGISLNRMPREPRTYTTPTRLTTPTRVNGLDVRVSWTFFSATAMADPVVVRSRPGPKAGPHFRDTAARHRPCCRG